MAKIGYASTFSVDTGTLGAYEVLAQVKNFQAPEPTVTDHEITNINQGTNVKDYLPGMVEPGSMSLELYWTPEAEADVMAIMGVTHNFKITSGTTAYVYGGYVNKCGGQTFEADNVVMFKIQVKLKTLLSIPA